MVHRLILRTVLLKYYLVSKYSSVNFTVLLTYYLVSRYSSVNFTESFCVKQLWFCHQLGEIVRFVIFLSSLFEVVDFAEVLPPATLVWLDASIESSSPVVCPFILSNSASHPERCLLQIVSRACLCHQSQLAVCKDTEWVGNPVPVLVCTGAMDHRVGNPVPVLVCTGAMDHQALGQVWVEYLKTRHTAPVRWWMRLRCYHPQLSFRQSNTIAGPSHLPPLSFKISLCLIQDVSLFQNLTTK